jgi:putative hydrolase of the HAD superfamily
MIKTVIFDLDNTLYNENDFVYAGFKHVTDEFFAGSLGVYTKLCELHKITSASHKIFDILMKEMGIFSKEKVMEMAYAYRTNLPHIECFSWVKPLFIDLRLSGNTIGLITNGRTMPQYNKIISLGLRKHVDKYLICDILDFKYWKPHPLSYRMMSQWLNVKPENCLYIDDNCTNVDAAVELGMQGICSKNPDDIPKAIKKVMNEKNMG